MAQPRVPMFQPSTLLTLSWVLLAAACGDDSGGGTGGSTSSTSASGTTTQGTGTTSATTGSGDGGATGVTSGSGGNDTTGSAPTTGSGGGGSTTGSGGGGTGGAGGECLLLPAPECNAMPMPAAAQFVTGVIGDLPEVSGGGDIPPGTYVLTAQIVGKGGTPDTRKLAVFNDGAACFTAIEEVEGSPVARYSGFSSTDGKTLTSTFTCPFEVSVSPAYEVLPPVDGKVAYATLNGGDYREWLQL